MAKAKFDRSKPHVNIGTIGHVDHGKTTLQLLSQQYLLTEVSALQQHSIRSIRLLKRRKEESQLTLLTSSMRQLQDTTLTLTALATLTTLRT